MPGPHHQPQGVPTMPIKQEQAPRWSEEDLAIAGDFEIFVAQAKSEQSETYIQKAGRLSHDFATTHFKKYSSLGGLTIHNYTDLPKGVRSALSHLAAEANKKKQSLALKNEDSAFKNRLQLESKALSVSMAEAQESGNARYLIEHADPEELDELLAKLPPTEETNR
jgi:hypothetical protein